MQDDLHSNVAIVDSSSDLVPGVYEGGLKTWECSLDLVNHLEKNYENVLSSTTSSVEVGDENLKTCYRFPKLIYIDWMWICFTFVLVTLQDSHASW
jgi:hypothetical protein